MSDADYQQAAEQASVLLDRAATILMVTVAATDPADFAHRMAEIGFDYDDPTEQALAAGAAIAMGALGAFYRHGAIAHACTSYTPERAVRDGLRNGLDARERIRAAAEPGAEVPPWVRWIAEATEAPVGTPDTIPEEWTQ